MALTATRSVTLLDPKSSYTHTVPALTILARYTKLVVWCMGVWCIRCTVHTGGDWV